MLHDVAEETAGIGWRKFSSVSVTGGSGIYAVILEVLTDLFGCIHVRFLPAIP